LWFRCSRRYLLGKYIAAQFFDAGKFTGHGELNGIIDFRLDLGLKLDQLSLVGDAGWRSAWRGSAGSGSRVICSSFSSRQHVASLSPNTWPMKRKVLQSSKVGPFAGPRTLDVGVSIGVHLDGSLRSTVKPGMPYRPPRAWEMRIDRHVVLDAGRCSP